MAECAEGIGGKIHPPREIGHPPVEFPVQKITYPSEGIGQGYLPGNEVGEAPKIDLALPAENHRCRQYSDKSAVVRHAANTDIPESARHVEGENNLKGISE